MQRPGAPCSVIPDRQGSPPTGAFGDGQVHLDCSCVAGISIGSRGSEAEMLMPCSVQDGATRQRCISSKTPVCLPQHSLSGNTPRTHLSESSRTKQQSIPEQVLKTPDTESCGCLEISSFLDSAHQGLKYIKGQVSFRAHCLLAS